MTVFINSHTNRQNGNGVYLIELIQNLKIYESKIITLSSNIINKKLEIIKLGFILKKKNNTATKIFEIFLLFFLILKNNQILRNEKIILTSDPPMIGLLLVILKKILNFKLYFWCQDIFPNTLLVSNVIKKNIFFMILTKLNKFILNNCDKIITISTDMKKTLIYEYQINIEKVKTVQNWPTIKNNFTKKIISKKNCKIKIYHLSIILCKCKVPITLYKCKCIAKIYLQILMILFREKSIFKINH
jgi:hypothetical protein